MPLPTVRIPYAQTHLFSRLVTDMLEGDAGLKPFAGEALSPESLIHFRQNRKQHPVSRKILVQTLKAQYGRLSDSLMLPAGQIELLEKETTFTITTAHQPNLAGGPLYTTYKILHAIALARWCREIDPEHEYVPVFYMGSEDADQEELNHFVVDGKRYNWSSAQEGAVGRMKVNAALTQQIKALAAQIEVLPLGKEYISLLSRAYVPGTSVQDSFFRLLDSLFGKYGLVVLIPDRAALKEVFLPLVQKEIHTQFSEKAVSATINALSASGYKVQAYGREINLFWLENDTRRRIVRESGMIKIEGSEESYTPEAFLDKAHTNPECISPNVILRSVFQETILPNVAFIGGGGEIAYWLELKAVFGEAGCPFPALVLRNSFALLPQKYMDQWRAMGFEPAHLFQPLHKLTDAFARRQNPEAADLSADLEKLNGVYNQLASKASAVGFTLEAHVHRLRQNAVDKIAALEQKMLRAVKRTNVTQTKRIELIKEAVLPGGHLQERTENLAGFYARLGPGLLDVILDASTPLPEGFTLIILPESLTGI